jgi:hypothetical protein
MAERATEPNGALILCKSFVRRSSDVLSCGERGSIGAGRVATVTNISILAVPIHVKVARAT